MTEFKAKDMTTHYTVFEPSNLNFTEVEDNDRSKGQRIAYPRYNHPSLGEGLPVFIQFPWSTLFSYGVPRVGDYYKTDQERSFLKYPLDLEDTEQKVLIEKMKELDSILSSNKMKKKLFGKKGTKMCYQPIYRVAYQDEEDDKQRPPYFKLKIDTTWPDYKVRTLVYDSVLDDTGKKRKRTLLEVSSIDDFANEVRYMSKIRPIIRPVKLWAQPMNKKDPQYGVTFKIIKIEREASNNNGSVYSTYMSNDAFLDSDEEDEEIPTFETNDVESSDESESDSDSEDDTEEVEATPKKKKRGRKTANS